MRVNTPLMTVVGGAAGAVFAVVSFQSHAAPDTSTPTAYGSRPTDSAALTSAPRITTMWLPCVKGSHLRHGACVTVRHRVVTVIDPAPVVVVPVTSGPPPAPAAHRPAKHHSTTHHSSGDDGDGSGDDGGGDDGPEPDDD